MMDAVAAGKDDPAQDESKPIEGNNTFSEGFLRKQKLDGWME